MIRAEALHISRPRLPWFYLFIGMLSVAPFGPLTSSGVAAFWVVLFVGAFVGGWAFLLTLPYLRWYSARSPICRWSVLLLMWQPLAFLLYPIYAVAAGLPIDLLRAELSLFVSLILPMFFFIGLQLRNRPSHHWWYLFGVVMAAVLYIFYLISATWNEGLLFYPGLIATRAHMQALVPMWPDRYPVVLIMVAFIALSLRSAAGNGHWNRVMLVTSLICGAVTVYSVARGAWVGLAVAVLVASAYRLPGWRTLVVAVVGMAIVGSMYTDLPARVNLLFSEAARYGRLENSTAIRVAIWEKSREAILLSPLFGYGQQGTGVILGEVETAQDTESGVAAHDDYIDMMVRTGLPGLLMYAAIVVALFRYGWWQASARNHRSAYLVAGLMGGLGYGLFHELLRYPDAAALFWYLAGSLAHEQAVTSVARPHPHDDDRPLPEDAGAH